MPLLRPSSLSFSRLLPVGLVLLAGCGGGGASVIGLSPSTTQTLDAGSTLNLTAAVVNDAGHVGATFSVAGPGTLGTATATNQGDSERITIAYAAPASVAAQTTATVTATSIHSPSQAASVTITLNPAITIGTTTLPAGTVSAAYATTIAASGGTGALTFTIGSGALPAGLTLNVLTGAISGKPTAAGTFAFTVMVTDVASVPGSATQAYSLTINSLPPAVTPATLPAAVVGTPYSQQLAYTGGGTSAPAFSIVTGSLPASSGLTLSASGLLGGTPAALAAGMTYSFSVAVTVGSQTSAPVPFSLTVASLPVVTTTSLPAGNVGVPYSQQLSYSGGSGTASFAITSGSLPASSGLTLSSGGLISGTPTGMTTYSFSVAVTVGTQTSAAQPLTLMINSLVVTSNANVTGEVSLPFSVRLTAAGGTGPYTWSLASGSNPLPAGLSVNAATGVISGMPTTATISVYNGVTVQVTDSVGASVTQAMTYLINAARGNAGNSRNAMLNGSYVFLLTGFDAAGKPVASAGRFSTDGAGNVSGGTMDTNGTGLVAAQTGVALLPSTYAVGLDNRGKVTFTTASGTMTFVLALDTVTAGVAGGGTLLAFDPSGQSRSGVFALQSASTTLTGGYAFGLQGFAGGGATVHRGAIGELQLNGSGTAASAEVLLSNASTPAPVVPASSTVAVGANGRGTLTLVLPNSAATLNFVLYAVSPSRFFLVSTDAAGSSGGRDLLSGQALAQTIANGSFTNATLGATAAFREERLTNGAPDVLLGLYGFSGTGLVTQASDENAAGALTSTSLAGTYTVAANGRVSLTLAPTGLSGCANCTSLQTFAYLTGANQGFVMDLSVGALTGFFEAQTAVSVAGGYSLGTADPLAAAATGLAGGLTATTSNLTGVEDSATGLTLAPDGNLAVTYVISAAGRFTLSGGGVGYVVSGTRALMLDGSTRPVVQVMQHQ